jgi:hypothetical protein
MMNYSELASLLISEKETGFGRCSSCPEYLLSRKGYRTPLMPAKDLREMKLLTAKVSTAAKLARNVLQSTERYRTHVTGVTPE